MPINPNVYQPHDGHPYTPSPWPSLKGKCDLCGQPEHLHVESQEEAISDIYLLDKEEES